MGEMLKFNDSEIEFLSLKFKNVSILTYMKERSTK